VSPGAASRSGPGPCSGLSAAGDGAKERALRFSTKGDRDYLVGLYYEDFLRMARGVLNQDGRRLLIEPSDVANEAAIRMLRLDHIAFTDVAHFLALASRIMRQILMDEHRRSRAAKRQPPQGEPEWIRAQEPDHASDPLEKIDDMLDRLNRSDPAKAKIIQQRFVAGMTIEEVARADGVSESTVKRHWRGVRTWLLAEIGSAPEARPSHATPRP
jgi:RNA polymerase sigma factor (TIGR02999 family)